MADVTELVPLTRELVQEVEETHPGVPLATVLWRALRRQKRCPHELLSCTSCGNVQHHGTWVDREAERRREPLLSAFYGEVHEAIDSVMRNRDDGTATSAARAVHGVARRHRLKAARQLLPPARRSKPKEVDDALCRFYDDALNELERHASPTKGKEGTAIGFGAVLKRVATKHGLSNANRPLPRLPHSHYYGPGGSRSGSHYNWIQDGPDAQREKARLQRYQENLAAQRRGEFAPAICPRPDDHGEAAMLALAGLVDEGRTPAQIVRALTEQGYRPPRGDEWTELLVRSLAKSPSLPGTHALPTLSYLDVVRPFVRTGNRTKPELDRWEQLGLAMVSRPGWRFVFSGDGVSWDHATKNLSVFAFGLGFTLCRGGRDRHGEDVAWWDFSDLDELLEAVDFHEGTGRVRWESRSGGMGRWETDPDWLERALHPERFRAMVHP